MSSGRGPSRNITRGNFLGRLSTSSELADDESVVLPVRSPSLEDTAVSPCTFSFTALVVGFSAVFLLPVRVGEPLGVGS